MIERERVYEIIYGSWTGTDLMKFEKSGGGRGMYTHFGMIKNGAINENYRRAENVIYIIYWLRIVQIEQIEESSGNNLKEKVGEEAEWCAIAPETRKISYCFPTKFYIVEQRLSRHDWCTRYTYLYIADDRFV